MQIFANTLEQMLVMFILIALGFMLRKIKAIPDSSATVLSRLETYIFVPALILYAEITNCNVETFAEYWKLLIYGLLLTVVSVLVSYPISKLFVRSGDQSGDQAYQRKIYQYALVFGNYGFMGNYIVSSVFGNDMFFRYILFTFLITMVCNSWGLYILVPKDQNAGMLQNLKKGLLSPPVCALVVGVMIGLLNLSAYIPDFLLNAVQSTANCQGPVAMILAGFVIGGYPFREMLLNKKVYVVSALRLLVIPATMMVVLSALGVPDDVRLLALITFGMPLGLNTIIYPSAYGGDPRTGASMAMISHGLAVITIPLLYLIFFVLL